MSNSSDSTESSPSSSYSSEGPVCSALAKSYESMSSSDDSDEDISNLTVQFPTTRLTRSERDNILTILGNETNEENIFPSCVFAVVKEKMPHLLDRIRDIMVTHRGWGYVSPSVLKDFITSSSVKPKNVILDIVILLLQGPLIVITITSYSVHQGKAEKYNTAVVNEILTTLQKEAGLILTAVHGVIEETICQTKTAFVDVLDQKVSDARILSFPGDLEIDKHKFDIVTRAFLKLIGVSDRDEVCSPLTTELLDRKTDQHKNEELLSSFGSLELDSFSGQKHDTEEKDLTIEHTVRNMEEEIEQLRQVGQKVARKDNLDGKDSSLKLGMSAQPRTITVTGVDPVKDLDITEIYFESRKTSGGGKIEEVKVDRGVIYIRFEEEAVAKAVVDRKHKLLGHTLQVKLAVPEVMYKDKVLLSGVPEMAKEEALCDYLEARTQLVVNEPVYGEGGDVMGSVSEPYSEDTSPVKTLALHPFQEELARTALKGINTIICAPTGSGKTYVAAKIIRQHLKQKGVRKIAFFANQVALVDQLFWIIKYFISPEYSIQKLSGDTEETLKIPLRELIIRNDILVLTPKIMLDALHDGEVTSLSEFTLLVFDEAHHTNSRHPYNRIMFSYMDIKLDESLEDQRHLPQIVGLTASVGVGKAKNIYGAVEHIRKLCANLDAYGGVTTVTQHGEDLAKHARTVGMDVWKTQRRRQDIFKTIISDNLMGPVEKMMALRKNVGRVHGGPRFADCLQPPVEKGGDPYTQWVSNLKREVANIEDQNVRRFFFSCQRILEIYNKSLAINEDCRSKDAVAYLEKELEKLYSAGITMDETDNLLKEQFEKMKPRLHEASRNPLCVNPKLTSLCAMITAAFERERQSRCMVFVKTRDLAVALKHWMEEEPGLSHLKPGTFTGQTSSEKGGMTRNQQLDAAELFRKGDHKVIIATSVAEEGMDFSQCNLVIRYEYVTNEIAMVQVKGRARAKDSQFVVLTGKTEGTAEKEELNLIRELMMNQAISQLQGEIHHNNQQFQDDILRIQKAAKAERDHEARNRKGRIPSDDEFEVRCVKCNNLACFSYEIRRIKETNHVVLAEEFPEKIRATPHPRPCSMGRDMEKRHKIACRKCGLDWGIGVIYRNWTFAVIKIESFVIIDTIGRRNSLRKWKNAPFIPPEITEDEITNYRSLNLSD